MSKVFPLLVYLKTHPNSFYNFGVFSSLFLPSNTHSSFMLHFFSNIAFYKTPEAKKRIYRSKKMILNRKDRNTRVLLPACLSSFNRYISKDSKQKKKNNKTQKTHKYNKFYGREGIKSKAKTMEYQGKNI